MQLKGIFVSLNHIKPAGKAASNKKEDSNMAFFNSAITVLQTLVVALGAGLGIWGAITPHVCRHTYCSNQAKAGMNPKTLQYLMGHSDIGVTLNTYTHLGLEDAAAEMARMEAVEAARREQAKLSGESEQMVLSQKMFKTV